MAKNYLKPEVQVTDITLSSMILAGSGVGSSSGAGKLNDIPTDEQW